MDLRVYYRKISEVERTIEDDCVVVMSLETPGGGRSGVPTEVPRRIAATMIVERRARLASESEAQAFREEQSEARQRAEELQAARQVKVAILPQSEIREKRPSARK
jgi:hypothetical protein